MAPRFSSKATRWTNEVRKNEVQGYIPSSEPFEADFLSPMDHGVLRSEVEIYYDYGMFEILSRRAPYKLDILATATQDPKFNSFNIHALRTLVTRILSEDDSTFFHRRLCLTMLCPHFNRISTMNYTAAVIEKFYTCHKDHGASYYFKHTKPQPDMPL